MEGPHLHLLGLLQNVLGKIGRVLQKASTLFYQEKKYWWNGSGSDANQLHFLMILALLML